MNLILLWKELQDQSLFHQKKDKSQKNKKYSQSEMLPI